MTIMMRALVVILLSGLFSIVGCKTKGDLRREQEIENLRGEVTRFRNSQVDEDVSKEEMRAELSRLGALLSQKAQGQDQQIENLRAEVATLTTRIQALEQKAVSEEMESVKAAPKVSAGDGLEAGKAAFEQGKFEAAIGSLKDLAKSSEHSESSKKALYLLAESYFGAKNFASSALEFSEFKKLYPQDPLVPTAVFRQGQAFKNLGKKREAKLFFQEVIDRFPKHALASKAKKELKTL